MTKLKRKGDMGLNEGNQSFVNEIATNQVQISLGIDEFKNHP